MSSLTITQVTENKSYLIQGIASGKPLYAEQMGPLSLRLVEKHTGRSSPYTFANLTDITIGGQPPADINDAVNRINQIVNFNAAPGGSGASRITVLLTGGPFASLAALETASSSLGASLQNNATNVTIATVTDVAVYEWAGTDLNYSIGQWVVRTRLDLVTTGGLMSVGPIVVTSDIVNNGLGLIGANSIVFLSIDGVNASNFQYSSDTLTSTEFSVDQQIIVIYK